MVGRGRSEGGWGEEGVKDGGKRRKKGNEEGRREGKERGREGGRKEEGGYKRQIS